MDVWFLKIADFVAVFTAKVHILAEMQGERATLAGADPSEALLWKQVSPFWETKLERSGTQYNPLPLLQTEGGKAKDILRKLLYKLTKISRVKGHFDLQINFF